MADLTLWHGSRRWEGKPTVRPAQKGRVECGPGIYLSTSYQTARKYALGGGCAMLFTLDANLSWLQDARIALGDMIDFLTQTPRLRNRAAAIADLRRASADQPETRVPAEFLVNICVDHDSAAGPAGPALAAWLTEKGIDASRHSVNALEDWIVVFNPSVVSRVQRVPAAEVDLSMRVLPKIADQLAMTQESESCEEIEDEVLGLSCSG